MTKRSMLLMSAIGAVMAVSPSMVAEDIPRRKIKPKEHWKKIQSDRDKKEKLKKASIKKQKLLVQRKNNPVQGRNY